MTLQKSILLIQILHFMKKHKKPSVVVPSKKTYKTPKINALGSVQKLTLKGGSNMDGMGTFGG
ncbi:hypothetical protein GCM10027190_47150 [Spirosoma areae]